MHFKNGREAKTFDPVVTLNYEGVPVVGHIYNLRPGTSCNCDVAVTIPGGVNSLTCQDVGKMYHAADAFAAIDLPGTVARPVSEPVAAAPVVAESLPQSTPQTAAATPDPALSAIAGHPVAVVPACTNCQGSGVTTPDKEKPDNTEVCQVCGGKGVQP